MVQVGRRLGFALKALHVLRGGQFSGQDHLERDDAAQADLAGPVNYAHAAARDLFQQFVIADVTDFGSRCQVPRR